MSNIVIISDIEEARSCPVSGGFLMAISRGGWPWGRASPQRRLTELCAMEEAIVAQKKIIEDQAKEAIRRLDLKREGITQQKAIVRLCFAEDLRAKNKDLAYRLAQRGIDLIEEVDAAEDQDAMRQKLLALLESTPDAGKQDASSPEDDLVDEASIERFLGFDRR
jgi:hypothetical protein